MPFPFFPFFFFFLLHLLDCLFKLMPRFKVRAEGDLVRMSDQVYFESIKMPARYLNCSTSQKFSQGNEKGCYEVDLSIRGTPFTIHPSYSPSDLEENFLKARLSSPFSSPLRPLIQYSIIARGVTPSVSYTKSLMLILLQRVFSPRKSLSRIFISVGALKRSALIPTSLLPMPALFGRLTSPCRFLLVSSH